MDCGRMVSRAGILASSMALTLCLVIQPATLRGQASAVASQPTALKLESTGLTLAPSDAAFYSSSLNLRDGILKEVESGVIGSLRQTNYMQELEAYLKDKWDNPDPQIVQAKSLLTGGIARELIKLAGDMAAQECFMFGDKSWSKFLDAFVQMQYDMADLNGQDPEVIREHLLSLDREYFDAIPIPTTVIGFQLSEDGNARAQLDSFEGLCVWRLAMLLS